MMRLICSVLLVVFFLAGCERRPLEKLAYEHAKVQARLNAENFERARDGRKRELELMREQFESAKSFTMEPDAARH